MRFHRRASRDQTALQLSYLETLAAQAREARSRYRRKPRPSEAADD